MDGKNKSPLLHSGTSQSSTFEDIFLFKSVPLFYLCFVIFAPSTVPTSKEKYDKRSRIGTSSSAETAEGLKACRWINGRNPRLCFCRNLISADSDSNFSRSFSPLSSQMEMRRDLHAGGFWRLRAPLPSIDAHVKPLILDQMFSSPNLLISANSADLSAVFLFTTAAKGCCLSCNHGDLLMGLLLCFVVSSQPTSSSTWPSWVTPCPSPPCSSLWPSSSTSGKTTGSGAPAGKPRPGRESTF